MKCLVQANTGLSDFMNKKTNIRLFLVLGLLILVAHACKKIPDPPENGNVSVFDDCIIPGKSSSVEIVTVNLQGYPKAGEKTEKVVKDLIKKMNPDVIAMQEVSSKADFLNLVGDLTDWEGVFYTIDESPWNLAYLYKTSEIELNESRTRVILTEDSYAFPRPPFEIYVTHKQLNIGFYLINIHLKCCGGTDNMDRRRDASQKLDNYIKSQRANDPVVLLGDFNDVISGSTPATNVFYNLVSSTSEYLFTDMSVALSGPGYWSYPSYPSHIDHIMVTNELFGNVDTAMVPMPDKCYQQYWINISDHRPVELVIK